MTELQPVAAVRNPYPGLRPFRTDEERLFFGREHQVDRMIDKLAANRFLAVVGGSGSGKSSLVNCGLRPALHRGNLASAGAAWRMAQFRPGNDPIGALARALAAPGVLFEKPMTGALSAEALVEATLRLGSLGLVDMIEQMQLPAGTQLLVVVDQFEELFRFRSLDREVTKDAYGLAEDAVAFVRLLLEARAQTEVPIHLVLTMRSDFLGDCSQFHGLPEAINEGQYLVPRLTRDEIRAAITGPTAVAGATISSLLVTRLLNDVGDNPDQLSILQHALNRTWSQWETLGEDSPLDLPHYQAIGTMSRALDQHAEKAHAELTTERQRQICKKLFKALTDKATDPRGVRRPTRLETLCALADATPAEITQVIDVFRKPSRSFLMPPAEDKLESETVIDISHESLMRVWERLKTLADEEAQSAHIYCRLAETAVLHSQGKAGLWDDPDLQVALDWQEKNKPNQDWARRYDPGFEGAIAFLQQSKKERDAEVADFEFGRKMRNVRGFIIALVVIAWLVDPLNLAQWSLIENELVKSLASADVLKEALPRVMARLPRVIAQIPEIVRILVHFLGYFILLFALGAIFRAFVTGAIGSGLDSALADSEGGIRWRNFQVRTHKVLDRFQSPRSKFVFSVSTLLAGVILFCFGLLSFVRDSQSVVRHGVPIGLILILLVPARGMFKKSWVPRCKVVQSILLKVGGVYAMVGLFFLFISQDFWGPGLLLIQNHWVLAIAGIVLFVLGLRKGELTAEETLAREPKQAPVLHLRALKNENPIQKETWISWISGFVRPDDEQILRPIFRVLGPFVTLEYPSESLSPLEPVVPLVAISNDPTELTRRSALVILQIDNRLTYDFLSQMRQTLQSLRQTLRPEQVLVYFSRGIDVAKLSVAYQKFVEATQEVFPGVWPGSIESNRFLAFNDGWQPFLCGPLTVPKFSWGKLLPLLGHRLDAARRSRAVAKSLQPYFERRNLVNSQKKLYGDCAIGLSSFPLFDYGLPAGVMICKNLWTMRRRWAALIALLLPPVGMIGTLYLGAALLGIASGYQFLLLESAAFLAMAWLGFPFLTYWLWRRLSGREIRQHIALGGNTQPLWKVILVLVFFGGWFFAFVVLLILSFTV